MAIVFERAGKLLKYIGSSLTGITALFYATGFLAENGRWIHLGVPQLEIISKEYLITGGKFVGFLLFGAVDGFVVLTERYLWFPLLLLGLLALSIAVWIGSRAKHIVILACQIGLLATAIYFLAIAPDSFLGPMQENAHYLSIATKDLLYRIQEYRPPPLQTLLDNYSLLTAMYLLFVAAPFYLRLLIKTTRLTSQQDPQPTTLIEVPHYARTREPAAYGSPLCRVQSIPRFAHSLPMTVVYFILTMMTILLPLNYAHVLIHKRFPVTEVHIGSTGGSGSADSFRAYLLRTTGQHYVFLKMEEEASAESCRIVLAKKSDVKPLQFVANKAVWD